MNSQEVRSRLVEALRLDLVGPGNDHVFARELLPESPSRWYLTGFLVPCTASAEQRTDETSTEEIAAGSDVGGTDDANAPDRDAARKSFLPSSMGLSVLVPTGVKRLQAFVAWGDYIYESPEKEPEPEDKPAEDAEPPPEEGPATVAEGREKYETGEKADEKARRGYRRHPREEAVPIDLAELGGKAQQLPVPNGDSLCYQPCESGAVPCWMRNAHTCAFKSGRELVLCLSSW